MNNQYYGVYLRVVSKSGKCVLEVKCNKLIHLMAINLAFFRFVYKMDFHEESPISLDWTSYFPESIQDQTILFRWRVIDCLDDKYLYSGIIKVFQEDSKPETKIRVGEPRLKALNFTEFAMPIVKKFVWWTDENWEVGRTLLLFASQIPDHFFWRKSLDLEIDPTR